MTCFHPVKSLYNKKAKVLLYNKTLLEPDCRHDLSYYGDFNEIDIDCGKCVGCMLKYRSGWIVRCMAQLYTNFYYHGIDKASFVTLTYDDEHLPFNANLDYEDVKKFMKNVRSFYDYYYGIQDIKFLCCGEFGENDGKNFVYGDSVLGRPHYHLIVFGVDFKEYFSFLSLRNSKKIKDIFERLEKNVVEATIMPYQDKYMRQTHGTTAFRSPLVEWLWKRGIAVIGDVTAQSCGYVAGYNVKNKMIVFNGSLDKQKYYSRNGENLKFPFTECSRGFGKEFFDRFYKSVYESGCVRIPGVQYSYPIPRVFNKWCEKEHPEFYEKVCEKRELYFQSIPEVEKTPERLSVKEEIRANSLSKLVRPLDKENGSLRSLANELLVALSQESSGV